MGLFSFLIAMTVGKERKFRIHGDNILECESALDLLTTALRIDFSKISFVSSAPYAPKYLFTAEGTKFQVQLFPGYGRWGVDIQQYFVRKGAPVREATDAIITELLTEGGREVETPLISMEFCGALPAGNNAWQRCGRALAMAYAGIPYLYFAELGGAELASDRTVKAARFPNPLVPFAYLTLDETEQPVSLPVYSPSPSISAEMHKEFSGVFVENEAAEIIRGIILGISNEVASKKLKSKAVDVVSVLASKRKRGGVLSASDWKECAANTGAKRAKFFLRKKMAWQKKVSIKSLTPTFKKLAAWVSSNGGVAAGSSDMPFCVLDGQSRKSLAGEIRRLHGKRVSNDFIAWISNSGRPLLLVWVAGFKPRGDDSRPDRGLLPLARMIFGRANVDVMTIIYGPAPKHAWNVMKKDPYELARTNGLWEAVLGLSDAVLLDTPTNKTMSNIGLLFPSSASVSADEDFPACETTPLFGEQDVDSTLHLLFAHARSLGVNEAMCNPPGGDWSGITLVDFSNSSEFRWTSLPRVSGVDAKRPDHVVQFKQGGILLAVESKDGVSTLEQDVGERLRKYLTDLVRVLPTSSRTGKSAIWSPATSAPNFAGTVLSGAAVRYSDKDTLKAVFERGDVDIAFAVEFIPAEDRVVVHVRSNKKGEELIKDIKKLSSRFGDSLQVAVS